MPSAVTPATASTFPNPTLPNTRDQTSSGNAKPQRAANDDADGPPTEDVQMADSIEEAAARSKKRKRIEKTHIKHQTTFKNLAWSYLHLELITPGTAALPPATGPANPAPSPFMPTPAADLPAASLDASFESPNLDDVTVSSLLQPPLQSFLGLTGSAIPIDILKTQGREVWIRIPRQDARAVQASLASWQGSCDSDLVPGVEPTQARTKVAWRVRREGEILGLVDGADGADLFQ